MKPPDTATIDNLQTAAQMMAHMSAQFRVDCCQLDAMGLGWLQCRVKKWYSKSEGHLDIFLDRLLYFDTDPIYDVGGIVGMKNVTDLLSRTSTWVLDVLTQLMAFRKASFAASMDYTSDLYEHAIRDYEKIAIKVERELKLIKTLGESGYIGSRLEDE